MRKNYILTCVILCLGAIAYAQTSNSKPTFVITEMKTPELTEGIIYREAKFDAEIEIKLRNVTPLVWSGTLSLSGCLEEQPNSFINYPYFEMVGKDNSDNASDDNSFVEIHNLGAANIERVEFVMGSTSTSYLVCAASIDGIDYFNSDYETDIANSVYQTMTVQGLESLCGKSYSYNVPDMIEDVEGSNGVIDNAREKLKYIRLNWGKIFAGAPTPDKKKTTNIFAIKVYTNADMTVGINELEDEAVEVQLTGRNLQLSESSDVQIYEVTGKIAAQYKNIDNAYLDNLKPGLYILKASSKYGRPATMKVIIR